MRVLITGAAGSVGSLLREGLAGRYERLRLHDLVAPATTPGPGEEWLTGDLGDPGHARQVVQDMDVLVHLAGVAREADWALLLRHNVQMPTVLFEAARDAGVQRIVFASSHHVIGMHGREAALDADAPLRPDSRYGVTKAFGEALCRLMHDKHGLQTVCVRIGACRPEPQTQRHLMAWLSPGDCVGLFARCIESTAAGHHVFYGVSANAGRRWDDAAAAVLGFVPADDAQAFAASVLAGPDTEGAVAAQFHGGVYAARERTHPR
jgi:uronate dehydrogenase